MKRRFFMFASAAIVAAPSLMRISTAAQAFTTETMTFKATEIMPDLGPMAMTIAGKDYIYDEAALKWLPAPDGTPNWRDFLPDALKRQVTRQLAEATREIHPQFWGYLPDAERGTAMERRVVTEREVDYVRLLARS